MPIDITLPPRQSAAFNYVVGERVRGAELRRRGRARGDGRRDRFGRRGHEPALLDVADSDRRDAGPGSPRLGGARDHVPGSDRQRRSGARVPDHAGADKRRRRAGQRGVRRVHLLEARSSGGSRGRSRRTPASRSTTCSRRSAGRRRRSTTRSSSSAAAATCSASRPVIDNETIDPFLVIGSEDKAAPPVYGPRAGAAGRPQPDADSDRDSLTASDAEAAGGTRPSSSTSARAACDSRISLSGDSTTTIHVGDTVRWVWVGGSHSTTSGLVLRADAAPTDYGTRDRVRHDLLEDLHPGRHVRLSLHSSRLGDLRRRSGPMTSAAVLRAAAGGPRFARGADDDPLRVSSTHRRKRGGGAVPDAPPAADDSAAARDEPEYECEHEHAFRRGDVRRVSDLRSTRSLPAWRRRSSRAAERTSSTLADAAVRVPVAARSRRPLCGLSGATSDALIVRGREAAARADGAVSRAADERVPGPPVWPTSSRA